MAELPPPPPPFPSGADGYGSVPRGTDGKAIASLVLGVVGLVACGILAGIPALVLGIISWRNIDESGGALGGRGLATAGIVLGILSVVASVVGIVIVLVRG